MIFPLAQRRKDDSAICIPATPEQSRDLIWFRQRYDLVVDNERKMRSLAAQYIIRQQQAASILDGTYVGNPVHFARGQAPRDYQLVAANLWKSVHGLLLADALGTGKTVIGITALTDPALRPACVILPGHLAIQWQSQLKRFTPALKVHVIQSTMPYSLNLVAECPACAAVIDTVNDVRSFSPHCPICKRRLPNNLSKRPPDVTILSYSKIIRWPDQIIRTCKSVVYDEVHALRSGEKTERWKAAKRISRAMHYRMGASGTPLFNLGGEAWNILECLVPGFLGSKETFQANWCRYQATSKEPPLRDPAAFGAYLKSQNVMLRRTAREVGIPVHDCEIIHQVVDADPEIFANATSRAEELAKLLLSEHNAKRGMDTLEFDKVMRQATGLSKVPSVVAFVEMLLEQGESVVVFAWHQSVHGLLMERLAHWHPMKYTGTETAEQKAAAVHKFQTPDEDEDGKVRAKVILISLRAGEGLDGLQFASCTAVVAELDWTWSVAKQNIGRIARDGQTRPCKAYFLVSDYGSDPIVSQVLGLKKDQLNGLIGEREPGPVKAYDSRGAIETLAKSYLSKRRLS